jgi:O-antigen ligase
MENSNSFLAKATQILIIALLISPFLMPKALLVLILLLFIIWVYEGHFSEKWSFLKANKYFFALPLLFLAYGFGLLYTENISYGFQKIETRLSFLFLPILLPTLRFANWKLNMEKYAYWFIGAATTGAFLSITRGLYYYFVERTALNSGEFIENPVGYNYLFSSHLTGLFMHPGYYAVFVLVAIFVLINLFLKNRKKHLNIWTILAFFILMALVFLSYAKAALLVLVVLCAVFGFQVAYRFKKLIYLAYSGLLAIMVLLIFYFFVPNTQERIQAIRDVQNQKLDPTSTESTQARVHAWMAAKSTLAKSPIFGFGTGDGNDELFKTYEEKGYTGALSVELNAHNEYLQTGLALGLIGVLFLIFPMVLALRRAFQTKNFMLASWSFAALIVFLFESYLNTLAGSLFFSLFFTIFALMNFSEDERVA